MSSCWQEGDWRAYVDGELPAEEMAAGARHLGECAACAALHAELAGRAARVGAMLMELDEAPVLAGRTAPVRHVWKWAAAGLAAAAALTAAFVLAPKRTEVASASRVTQPVAAAVATSGRAAPAIVKRAAAVKTHRRTARPQYFLALDDEPIDTGTVMRVALESGIEADVIVDDSGRPRAIRAIQ